MKNQRNLIIAAHFDDEVLGCGGLLQGGDDNHVVIISESCSSRYTDHCRESALATNKKEKIFKKMAEKYGYDSLFCGFADNQLDNLPLLILVKHIESMIRDVRPSRVITHYEHDLNIDHQIVSQSVRTALRPGKHKSVKQLLEFETLSSTELSSIPFKPNYFFSLSEKQLDEKKNMMNYYESEINDIRNNKNIEALARLRGCQCGFEYAEGYRSVFQYI